METEQERQDREDRDYLENAPERKGRWNGPGLNHGLDLKTKEGQAEYARRHRDYLKKERPDKWKEKLRKHYEKRALAGKEARADENLRYKYGLSLSEKARIYQEQGKRCPLCGNLVDFSEVSVDHDHIIGKVRGVICDLCNMAIGCMRDDPNTAEKIANYLRKFFNENI